MRKDIINIDERTMIIYRENIGTYLTKYFCANENDFENTMWLNYGISVEILD